MSFPDAPGSRPPRGYRFGEVEVDALRRSVSVAGEEVACRPLVFQLLLLLCEAGGAVVERVVIFSRLWPENVVASDESLTQIAHRLRAMLGTSGGVVRTVRGVGFRLDAEIELLFAEPPVSPPNRETAIPAPPVSPVGTIAPCPCCRRAGAPRPRRGGRASLDGLAITAGPRLRFRAAPFGPRERTGRRRPIWCGRPSPPGGMGTGCAPGRCWKRPTAPIAPPRSPRRCWRSCSPATRAGPGAPRPNGACRPAASAYQQLLVRYAGLSRVSENAESVATLSALLEIRPEAWALRLRPGALSPGAARARGGPRRSPADPRLLPQ